MLALWVWFWVFGVHVAVGDGETVVDPQWEGVRLWKHVDYLWFKGLKCVYTIEVERPVPVETAILGQFSPCSLEVVRLLRGSGLHVPIICITPRQVVRWAGTIPRGEKRLTSNG